MFDLRTITLLNAVALSLEESRQRDAVRLICGQSAAEERETQERNYQSYLEFMEKHACR